MCGWANRKKIYKCKGYKSKNHGLANCLKAKRASEFGARSRKGKEYIDIFKKISTNKNFLYQFIFPFSYLFAPSRPNCFSKFRLVDTSKFLLINLLSLPISNTLINLLYNYPGSFQIHLSMIL